MYCLRASTNGAGLHVLEICYLSEEGLRLTASLS